MPSPLALRGVWPASVMNSTLKPLPLSCTSTTVPRSPLVKPCSGKSVVNTALSNSFIIASDVQRIRRSQCSGFLGIDNKPTTRTLGARPSGPSADLPRRSSARMACALRSSPGKCGRAEQSTGEDDDEHESKVDLGGPTGRKRPTPSKRPYPRGKRPRRDELSKSFPSQPITPHQGFGFIIKAFQSCAPLFPRTHDSVVMVRIRTQWHLASPCPLRNKCAPFPMLKFPAVSQPGSLYSRAVFQSDNERAQHASIVPDICPTSRLLVDPNPVPAGSV